jgi:hypothetical protein
MLKKTLALVGLTLSLSANATIVDLGNITRDTSTGLDWLDLTETNGRSYTDISNKLGAEQEFAGWRYATGQEVQDLWVNFGLTEGTNLSISTADTNQYASFINAVNHLGNTHNEYNTVFDYGSVGFTAAKVNGNNSLRYVRGMFHSGTSANTTAFGVSSAGSEVVGVLHTGSYLVAPSSVPVPAAAWLFGSALVGLAGIKRKKGSAKLT